MRFAVKQHEAVHAQVLLHADADGGAPLVPPLRPPFGGVERGPEETYDRDRLHTNLIRLDNVLYKRSAIERFWEIIKISSAHVLSLYFIYLLGGSKFHN